MNYIQTPLIDFAPKAVSTIIECQNILAEYIIPDSGISDRDCIIRLLGVLDSQDLVKQINIITKQ